MIEGIAFTIDEEHYVAADAQTAIQLLANHVEKRLAKIEGARPQETAPEEPEVAKFPLGPSADAICHCQKPWPVIGRTRCMTCNLPLRKES